MNDYIKNIVESSRYHVGDILVFVGGNTGHSSNFTIGGLYKIRQKSIIDQEIDMLDNDYGKECIYFEDYDYGCLSDFADVNFSKLSEYREKKIKDLLNGG